MKIVGGSTTSLWRHASASHKKRVQEVQRQTAQPTILDAFKKKETYPRGSSRKTFLDKALARMICEDLQPVSLVDDPGFRKFCSALDSKYQPPCQKMLRTVMLPKLFEVCQERMKKDLANTNDVCITTDLWTSLNAASFITITAPFWREEDLKLVSMTLDCLQMNGCHTG